jgi:hypothetical protein
VLLPRQVLQTGKVLSGGVPVAGKLRCQGIILAVCPAACFYITDSTSNHRFLVDTGSAFSIMPWKSQRTPYGPSLSMADSRRIPCQGEQPFTVIINGVPRWWDFLHTAVSYPIIGVDFLSHHGPHAANLQLLSGPLPVAAVVPATV